MVKPGGQNYHHSQSICSGAALHETSASLIAMFK